MAQASTGAKAGLLKPVCMNRSVRRRVSEQGPTARTSPVRRTATVCLLTREKRAMQDAVYYCSSRQNLCEYNYHPTARGSGGRADWLGQFRKCETPQEKSRTWASGDGAMTKA